MAPQMRAGARRLRHDCQRLRVEGLRRNLLRQRAHDGVRRLARQQPWRFIASRLRRAPLQVGLGRSRVTELVPQLFHLQLEEASGTRGSHRIFLAPQPLPPSAFKKKFNSEILIHFSFRELFCSFRELFFFNKCFVSVTATKNSTVTF